MSEDIIEIIVSASEVEMICDICKKVMTMTDRGPMDAVILLLDSAATILEAVGYDKGVPEQNLIIDFTEMARRMMDAKIEQGRDCDDRPPPTFPRHTMQ